MNSNCESNRLYDILQCSREATFEEIKKSYQSLALQLHPDKSSGENTSIEFIELDRAWKVLRDPEIRAAYDAEQDQQLFKDRPIVNESLQVQELDFDEESSIYFKSCRCGGEYSITMEELVANKGDIYVNCCECSLVIEINQ